MAPMPETMIDTTGYCSSYVPPGTIPDPRMTDPRFYPSYLPPGTMIDPRYYSPYVPPPRPKPVGPFADFGPQNLRTAEDALAYYNKKRHTDYELVEALGSNGFLRRNIWFHTSFKAKPRTSHNGDSSAKLFFAEYKLVHPGPRNVFHCCRILKGVTTDGCKVCGDGIVHPTRGFRQGLHDRVVRNLRPRSLYNPGRVDTSSSSKRSI